MGSLYRINRIKSLKIILSGIISLFLTLSCADRGDKPDRTDLIPDKALISILSDVYVADGLLTLPKIRSKFGQRDSVSNYTDIIEKHGYSKEAMDKTMKYYFLRKPRKLISIYDQVLERLSKLEAHYSEVLDNSQLPFENLWTGNPVYHLPDPAGNDSVSFELKLDKPAVYKLTFTVTVFPSDLSYKPCFTAYLCNPDSTETGTRIYLAPIHYIKDGQPHTYTVTRETKINSVFCMKGRLYDYANYPDSPGKHVRIENISFTYTLKVI
ncbi:MAG: DUF4296 domain-containing protein [Bacteroidales bacterium]|nr:DUF4296 domain-containing protein [Bacteroidales bacterium]